MNITFVSADETIRMTFGIDPWSAVTDLTKIEKELGKDLTDIIQKAIDVAFNVTSQTFTRGPKDAYIVSYSWELQPIIGGHITKDNSAKSISITVGDSDHSLYEFENLEDILEEYRRVVSNFEERTEDWCKAKNSLSDLKRKYTDEIKMVSSVRAERDSNRAKYLVFLDKLAKVLDVSYSNPNYVPAKEQDILRAVKTLSENYEVTTRVHGKLEKDYEELGKAYSSVLKWNNSYADVRRLLEVPADADAGKMVNALNKLKFDCETCDRLRKSWHERYKSEHERANGEHKRAEKCFGEIAALKTQVASLERSLNAAANEQVGLDAFKNECRKLRDEKAKVIKALGQDIWDDCVK